MERIVLFAGHVRVNEESCIRDLPHTLVLDDTEPIISDAEIPPPLEDVTDPSNSDADDKENPLPEPDALEEPLLEPDVLEEPEEADPPVAVTFTVVFDENMLLEYA